MVLLDRRGRRRAPVTLPEHRLGKKPANAGKKYPPEPLTRDEIMRLLSHCDGRGVAGIRDKAMIALLWRAGLRVAELVALDPRDIYVDVGAVTVRLGKGAKRRVVGIDDATIDLLMVWLAVRAELLADPRVEDPGLDGDTGPLFCTVQFDPWPGRRMHASVFRENLHRMAPRVGIARRVHPHGLRHTHAFELMCEGTPTYIIQKQLGHKDLETTERYLDHLAPMVVVKWMRQRRWEGALTEAAAVVPSVDRQATAPPLMTELAIAEARAQQPLFDLEAVPELVR